jgi:hypothetical protein
MMALKRLTNPLLLSVCLLLASNGCRSVPDQAGTPYEAGFQERGRILSEKVADAYQPTDYTDRGKYSFPVVIARMDRYGPEDERAVGYLQEYADGKYGFFHFPFVGLARILCRYPNAPAVEANREAFLREILFHDPLYHYNALTSEGTENHISMSRTSGYLFAQEAMRYPALRERAVEWKAALHVWIMDWSKRIYAYGTGEWDSSPYTAYNLVGWLNLFDYAEDRNVREAARAVLDYYAANIALKLTQNVLGGPESRGGSAYGPLPRTATEYLGWIWFGQAEDASAEGFFKRSEYIQAMHAVTSAYRPPAQLIPLARKQVPVPAVYHNNKPDYLLQVKAQSRETFLIEETFTLGTVQTPYGGWANTNYGVVNWKLVVENPEGLPAVLIGNGGMKSATNPRGRNPFDQFLQYRNVVVQMTRVPAEAEAIAAEVADLFEDWKAKAREDFQARWGRRHMFEDSHISNTGMGDLSRAGVSLLHLPDGMEPQIRGTAAFLQYARTYVAARTLSGDPPVFRDGKLLDKAGRDQVSGFVVEVVNAGDYASLDAFISEIESVDRLKALDEETAFVYTNLSGDALEFTYSLEGEWQELIFDWGYGVREQRIGFNTADWKQADWPTGYGQGRIPLLRVNGAAVPHPGPDTVIEGPLLKLRNRILQIQNHRGEVYRVDYTSDIPHVSHSSD